MDLLLSLLPTRGVLVTPWIVGLAFLHWLVRQCLAAWDGRQLAGSMQLAHEGLWFGTSIIVLAGVVYEPILKAFFEIPWYLAIAAFSGLIESIRLLRT